MENNENVSRRDLLSKGLKTAAALGLGMGSLGAFGDKFSVADRAWASFDPMALRYQSTETCVLTCTSTLGPCYFNTGLVRSDIRESYAGLNTKLVFRVVNADTCLPMSGVSVDICIRMPSEHIQRRSALSATAPTRQTRPRGSAVAFRLRMQTALQRLPLSIRAGIRAGRFIFTQRSESATPQWLPRSFSLLTRSAITSSRTTGRIPAAGLEIPGIRTITSSAVRLGLRVSHRSCLRPTRFATAHWSAPKR